MRHDEVRSWLGAYLEGDLALGQRALVDAHLDTCGACAKELRELRGMVAMLRGLPDPPMTTQLADRVMARVRAGEAAPSVIDRALAVIQTLARPRLLGPVAAACGGLMAVTWLSAGPQDTALRVDEPPAAERSAAKLRLDQGIVGASVPEEELTQSAPPAREPIPGAIDALPVPDPLVTPARFLDHVLALEPGLRASAVDRVARDAVRDGRSEALEQALLSTRDPRAADLVQQLRQVAAEATTR